MTTSVFKKMKKLYDSGLNDRQIAAEIGCSCEPVREWRKKNGIPCQKRSGNKWPRKWYKVYSRDSGKLLASGPKKECAKSLGISEKSFSTIMSRIRRGAHGKYKMEEGEYEHKT